ncbi:MAG: ABC transporter ATP-binding protein [Tepidisphaerales bacterium]
MAGAALALDLRHVEKRYGRSVHALKGIALQVARGEVFGLLGPNGAGKSTLVKILMTVIRPTRAEGWVLGEAVGTKASLRRVGYLPENHRFPRYLTGRQTLDFFAALSGAPRAIRRRRVAELLELVGMTEWADQPVARYSKGMMQRVGVAQALTADPELIVLDEPTDGVDPIGRRDIRDVLLRLREQGKTVFINSHLLSELEMVCDRVAILVSGQVARQGTMSELVGLRGHYELEVTGGVAPQRLGGVVRWTTPADGLAAAGGGAVLTGTTADGTAVQWKTTTADGSGTSAVLLTVGTTDVMRLQPLLDAVRAAGGCVVRLEPVQPTLEELFMEAVGAVEGGRRPGARLRAT